MRDQNTETTMIVINDAGLVNIVNFTFVNNEELRAIYLTNVQDVYINTGFCGADYDIPSQVETDKEISLYITGLPIDQKSLSNLEIEIPEDLTGQHSPQHGACIEVLRVSNVFKLADFLIQNNIFVDTSIVNINNGDLDAQFDTRVILSNVTYINNIIAITDDTGNDAAFKYSGQGIILIAMDSVTF